MASRQHCPGYYDVPFQREFVERFIQSGNGARHLLIAPPGAGKTKVTAQIVRTMMAEGQIERGLILCPAPLVGQFEYMLTGEGAQPPVVAVDRFRLRECEATTPPGESPFPQSIIAVMSIDLAKQPDVAASITATPWDILVVDEAHLLVGQRATLVRQLLSSAAVMRVLLTTASPLKDEVSEALSITDWTVELQAILDKSKQALRMEHIQVSSPESELALIKQVTDLASRLLRDGRREIAQIVISRANSSFYALEQALLRLRNRAIHDGSPAVEPKSVPAMDEVVSMGTLSPDVVHALSQTLLVLNHVEGDSKLDALSALLTRGLNASKRAALIFSRFADTVEYLTSALADREFKIRGVTGSMSISDRIAAISAAAAGSITAVTLASVQGCDLGGVYTYVAYEEMEESQVRAQVGDMLGLKRDRPVEVFAFRDILDPRSLSTDDRSEVES